MFWQAMWNHGPKNRQFFVQAKRALALIGAMAIGNKCNSKIHKD
jgi:hypothetical protein